MLLSLVYADGVGASNFFAALTWSGSAVISINNAKNTEIVCFTRFMIFSPNIINPIQLYTLFNHNATKKHL